MANFEDIERTPATSLDGAMLALCRSVSAKRARTVIDHILEHGVITTEDLSELYGYDHPPRAIRDVRENGIPLITHNVTSLKTGRRIAAYTFDSIRNIKAGRIGGRKAFSKQFKQELLELYGSRDTITGAYLEERYLQIDHRIPYEVAGDDNGVLNARDFMLVDASTNRAKSWSCEHCDNFLRKQNPDICRSCFWASPEEYLHIAETPSRRVDLVWSGDNVDQFDRLRKEADAAGLDFATFLRDKLSK